MAINDRLTDLLEKVRTSQASAEECEELASLVDADQSGDIVRAMNAYYEAGNENILPYNTPYWQSVLQEVLVAGKSIPGKDEEENETDLSPVHRIHFLQRYRWWAVAAILLLFAGSTYYFLHQPVKEIAVANPGRPLQNNLAPGGSKAVLTLANGSAIILDSAHTGTLAQQGNTMVVKQSNGQLAYNTQNEKPTEVLYNTLTTPRGGQYQLVLPDGSKVWLNAASAISYPTAFTGSERKVEIKGEAYFEIAKNTAMPFIVKVNDAQVQVLGTHFNINAYSDEDAIKTTLLEGAVKVTKDAASTLLKPGQQAILGRSSNEIRVQENTDLDAVLAWKNGYFSFNQTDLATIMRQIARWYDVDIVYSDKVPERRFGGEIPRNTNAAEVLKMLEESKVHFRIEGRKVIVLP